MTNELKAIKMALYMSISTHGEPCRSGEACQAITDLRESLAAVERLEAERQQLIALGNKFRSGDVGLCEIVSPVQFVEMLLAKLAERQSDTRLSIATEALERISRMVCFTVVANEPRKVGCKCFSCAARSALAQIRVLESANG